MINSLGYCWTDKRVRVIAAFFVVFLGAAAARFYNLAGHGLSMCDTFIYSSVAKQWYFDHLFVNPWSKPGYHLLGCLGIRLFGYYDFTLPFLGALCDLGNIALLVLIGFKMKVRAVFVLSAAVIYAFLPFMLEESMKGLAHLSSTMFFLGGFYVFLIYFNSGRTAHGLLFLTGLLTVFAGNVHPTLLCGAVFYGVILAGQAFKKPSVLTGLAAYALGGASVFAGFALLMAHRSGGILAALQNMAGVVAHHRQIGTQGHQGSWVLQAVYALGGYAHILTVPFVIFLVVTAAVLLLRRKRLEASSGIRSFDVLLLWGVVVSFLLINLFTILAWQYRFLIPSVPLIVLGVAALIDRLARNASNDQGIGRLFLAGCIIIAACNVWWNRDLIEKRTPTVYRQMANVLYHKVTDESRLLITPSFFFAPTFYLEEVYFNGDNLYRPQGPWKPEISLLQAYNIKYVAVAKDLNTDDKKDNGFFPSNMKGKSEYFAVYYGLEEIGSKLLYDSDQVSIFEVPVNAVSGLPHKTPPGYPFFNVGHDFNKWHPLYVVGMK